MNLSEIIFVDHLPKLDLHGVERQIARVMVKDFIADNFKLQNYIVVIVHGIGSGIVKKEVLATLKENKLVEEYKMMYNNPGCTIVKIKS